MQFGERIGLVRRYQIRARVRCEVADESVPVIRMEECCSPMTAGYRRKESTKVVDVMKVRGGLLEETRRSFEMTSLI